MKKKAKAMPAPPTPPDSASDVTGAWHQRLVLHSSVTIYQGDCAKILPILGGSGVFITDPPYGMKKAEWDEEVPNWLPMAGECPVATFCGVVGMRDYPTPDWVGAWVRQGSTQRNGKLKGFNNWEPILFYNIAALKNDVIAAPNYHDDYGHPSVKPDKLMGKLVDLMPEGTVIDPFMGTGTTGIAAIRQRRPFIGIERDPKHFETARQRIAEELSGDLFMQNDKAQTEPDE